MNDESFGETVHAEFDRIGDDPVVGPLTEAGIRSVIMLQDVLYAHPEKAADIASGAAIIYGAVFQLLVKANTVLTMSEFKITDE